LEGPGAIGTDIASRSMQEKQRLRGGWFRVEIPTLGAPVSGVSCLGSSYAASGRYADAAK